MKLFEKIMYDNMMYENLIKIFLNIINRLYEMIYRNLY